MNYSLNKSTSTIRNPNQTVNEIGIEFLKDQSHRETKRMVQSFIDENIPSLNTDLLEGQDMNKSITKNLKEAGNAQIASIFGSKYLQGNLNLANVITYNDFRRIDKLIRLKLKKVGILFNSSAANMVISMALPLCFFKYLSQGELTHYAAWFNLLPFKIFQFITKVATLRELNNTFHN